MPFRLVGRCVHEEHRDGVVSTHVSPRLGQLVAQIRHSKGGFVSRRCRRWLMWCRGLNNKYHTIDSNSTGTRWGNSTAPTACHPQASRPLTVSVLLLFASISTNGITSSLQSRHGSTPLCQQSRWPGAPPPLPQATTQHHRLASTVRGLE